MRRPRDRAPIWTRPAPGSRRPRLTREQIAAAAFAIADREGFAAVSMRRIAQELGAGTMTLYHYVRTKDDLLALMDDSIMAEVLIPPAEVPKGWREGLAMIARRTRDAFLRHPWAMHALQGARLGPNGLKHIEQSMAVLSGSPLDQASRLALSWVLDDFVFGWVLRTLEAPTTMLFDVRAINSLVRAHLASGDFPHMAAWIGDEAPSEAFARAARTMDDEQRFEFGLAALLDGVDGKVPLTGKPAARRRR
jgi:AcrR family transcriptional regulator